MKMALLLKKIIKHKPIEISEAIKKPYKYCKLPLPKVRLRHSRKRYAG